VFALDLQDEDVGPGVVARHIEGAAGDGGASRVDTA